MMLKSCAAPRGVKSKSSRLLSWNLTAKDAQVGMATATQSSQPANVQVVCRVRPPNAMEKRSGAVACTRIIDGKTICVDAEVDSSRYTFDHVFESHATQQQVYEDTAKPLISSFLEGINCTVLAYGQTGSGKTHTIFGPKDGQFKQLDEQGIVPRLVTDLFQRIRDCQRLEGATLDVKISILEIYLEQIRDLLQPAVEGLVPLPSTSPSCGGGLRLRENSYRGVYVEDMTEISCDNESTMISIIRNGQINRAVSSTRMNKDSSRSHCVISLQATRKDSSNPHLLKRSTMFIVDLAGSELVNKTLVSGKLLQEAKAINKSLSALSNVIKALVEGQSHIPYRDSKLTRLLQDSLGGNSKTCLILAVSSSICNSSETISTLRFGLRAKEIKNTICVKLEQLPLTIHELRELYQKALQELAKKNDMIDKLQQQVEDMEVPLKLEVSSSQASTSSSSAGNVLSSSVLQSLIGELERQKAAQKLMEEEIDSLVYGMKSLQPTMEGEKEWDTDIELIDDEGGESPHLLGNDEDSPSLSNGIPTPQCDEKLPRASDRLGCAVEPHSSIDLGTTDHDVLQPSHNQDNDENGIVSTQPNGQGAREEQNPLEYEVCVNPIESLTEEPIPLKSDRKSFVVLVAQEQTQLSNNQTVAVLDGEDGVDDMAKGSLVTRASKDISMLYDPPDRNNEMQLSALRNENDALRQELDVLSKAFQTLETDHSKLKDHMDDVTQAYETLQAKANSLLIDTSLGKPTLHWKQHPGESPTLLEWLLDDKTSRVSEVLSVGARSSTQPRAQPTIKTRMEDAVSSEFGFMMSWLEKFQSK